MILYIGLATLATLVWIPVLIRFFRAWQNRKNPVSLAICAMIATAVWEAVAHVWMADNNISERVLMVAFSLVSILVALNFHLAFYWSRRKFPEERK